MTFISGGVVGGSRCAHAMIVTLSSNLTDRRELRSLMISTWIQRVSAMTSPAPGRPGGPPGPPGDSRSGLESASKAWRATRSFQYGSCLIVMAVAVILDSLGIRYESTHLFVVIFAAAILVANVLGTGPGIVATLLATAYSGFLTIPRTDAGPATATSIVAIIIFLVLGVAISMLCGSIQRGWQRRQGLAERALRDSEDRFEALMETVGDNAIFMLDPAGHVLSWNSAAERIKGWVGREIAGRHFSLFFPEEATYRGEPDRHLAIAAAEGSFREESERVRKDGSRFWADVTMRAIRDQDGQLQGFAKVIRDITDRVDAASDRQEGQRRMTNIIESAMDAIITVDVDHRIVQFNRAAEVMFLCSATEALGQTLTRFIPPHARAAHPGQIRAYAATGVTNRAMGRIDNLSALRGNGEEFPIEASISQAQVDGSPLYTVIVRDITQRRRAEERQSLLLQELAHRVKNTLAIVQSVVAQTRRFASPEEFHTTLTGRLTALGAAHDLLTASEWAGATLADVVRFAFEPYDTGDTVKRWTIEGPGIWLASNEAVTLSLIFHELATNAAKYGALSDGKGSVAVQWTLTPEGEPAVLTIDWHERGGPKVTVPVRRGFGSRLLNQAMAHELGGETILTFLPDGAECRLQLPLSAKVDLQ
jgi:PAS domain S-box-containing protein